MVADNVPSILALHEEADVVVANVVVVRFALKVPVIVSNTVRVVVQVQPIAVARKSWIILCSHAQTKNRQIGKNDARQKDTH